MHNGRKAEVNYSTHTITTTPKHIVQMLYFRHLSGFCPVCRTTQLIQSLLFCDFNCDIIEIIQCSDMEL